MVHVTVSQIKVIPRIHRRHVAEPNHRQEENGCKVLENWINSSESLDLVPLVCDEVGTPDGNG